MSSTQTQPQEGILEINEVQQCDAHSGDTPGTGILKPESLKETLDQSDGILDTFKCDDPTNQTVNPLMIELVLRKLMRMLSVETLTEVRMVNSTWNHHAIEQICVRHKPIHINDFKEFNQTMMNTLNFPFGQFKFSILGKQVFKLLYNFGQMLTSVTIWTEELTLPALRIVLTTCKRLDYLEIWNTPFLSNENFIFLDTKEHQIPTLKNVYLNKKFDFSSHFQALEPKIDGSNVSLLEGFFQLIPKLETIRLPWEDHFFVGKSFQAMNMLPKFPVQNLQKLYIEGTILEDQIKTLHNCNFKFKSMHLGHILMHSDTLLLSEFLESQRNSLLELWINSIFACVVPGNDNPPRFCFPIMPKLEIFGRAEIYKGYGTYPVDLQLDTIPSTFPNLQKLEVSETNVFEFVTEGSPTESIQELVIVYEDDDHEIENDTFQKNILGIRDMFLNLQTLRLHEPTSRWAQTVFDVLINLTELDLEHGRFVLSEYVDTVLTGIQEVHCSNFVRGGELLTAKPAIEIYLTLKDGPGVCDLKNLRKLKLQLAYYGGGITRLQKMTDATGYLALLQMKPLAKLEIVDLSAQFSDHCIAALTSYHREFKITKSNLQIG